ncbi:transcription intermediary factor 1-alpha-like isoform X2 [Mercenaria mercenaria]|uniref:transcription intermediary factor 1-alpha-like isoform X2 n=1 Tax=Mercenaria mercenaria TaxID=6596 RepID=UPI00234E9BA2|nr:transcription intermediary factor 1-alpha-like isoform X2 [Mercenaria mercenaria]
MAESERGDLTSVKDGSDADFDIVCTPCWEDSIREEAVKYCPECQEYLCKTCTRHHGRQKITRSHKLLDRNAAKQASAVSMTTKCHYHPDRDIEMYCGTHDMVCCLKCIATEHRLYEPHHEKSKIVHLRPAWI